MWNSTDATQCERCEAPNQLEGMSNQRKFHNGTRSVGRSVDSRRSRGPSASASPSRRRRLPSSQPQQEREWPPFFEENGSAFVLDSRSGMFYEALSDFFYDPKSKLYYGNKKGSYFRYDEAKNPPFVEFHRVIENPGKEGETPVDPTAVALDPIADATIEVKKTSLISINIKSKKMKKRGKVSEPKVAPQIGTKHQKEQVANIEKWSERQAEIQAELSTDSSAQDVGASAVASKNSEKILKTAKGEPICTICKRKFPTVEKLRLHEKLSELHKQNLAKQTAAAGLKRKPPPVIEYQDRAKKRRELHGPDAAIGLPTAASLTLPPNDTEPQKPGDSLGTNNIGNQMLQKLGWKEGASLGRKSNEESDSASGENGGEQSKKEDSTIENLRQDWDRIESMAAKQNRHR